DIGEQLPFFFTPSSLGNILRDTKQKTGVTGPVENRHFLRVEEANALVARLDRFLGDVDYLASGQRFAIFLDEKLGLLPRPELIVGFTEKPLPRPTEQVFAGTVEPQEPQRRAVLDEQHQWNVFDDGVEIGVRIFEFILDALALRDIPQ